LTHILSGKREICQFMGRGWKTVENWIINMGFPAKMIAGIWESDSELITAWRRGLVNGQPKSPKLVRNRGKKILKTNKN